MVGTCRSCPPGRVAIVDSGVRPGREHDMSAARADLDLLARITEWVGDGALAMADLGYEGELDIFRIPFKKPADTTLTVDQQPYNTVHGALRCLGERANSLIKTTYKALRRNRGCPLASARCGPRSPTSRPRRGTPPTSSARWSRGRPAPPSTGSTRG
ncbi:transposase family protein [Actinokineospora alba]